MNPEGSQCEACELTGLVVPKSLCDLVETWSQHSGHDDGDILRSVLNLGLASYLEKFPNSVRLMADVLNDLDAMAPEQAQHERLHAVEQADGRLRLQQEDAGKPEAVTIEVAAQPALAALLKGHAERADTTISEMLLQCWCADALTHYNQEGNVEAMRAIVMAWGEHGVPEHLRRGIELLTCDLFPADTTVAH